MTRKTKIQKDTYKTSIVKHSLSIINKGKPKVTIRELSRLSNISIGSVYNIFPSYDDLVLHIKSAILEQLHECFLAPDLSKKDYTQSIYDLTYIFFGYIKNNHLLWSYLISTPTPSNQIPDWYQKKIDSILAIISAEFKKIPGISSVNIETSTIIFWSNLQGLSLIKESQKLAMVTTQPYENIIDTFVENYLHGLTYKK